MDYFTIRVNFSKATKGLVYSKPNLSSRTRWYAIRTTYLSLCTAAQRAYCLLSYSAGFSSMLSAGFPFFYRPFPNFELSVVNKVTQTMSLVHYALCKNKHEQSRDLLGKLTLIAWYNLGSLKQNPDLWKGRRNVNSPQETASVYTKIMELVKGQIISMNSLNRMKQGTEKKMKRN